MPQPPAARSTPRLRAPRQGDKRAPCSIPRTPAIGSTLTAAAKMAPVARAVPKILWPVRPNYQDRSTLANNAGGRDLKSLPGCDHRSGCAPRVGRELEWPTLSRSALPHPRGRRRICRQSGRPWRSNEPRTHIGDLPRMGRRSGARPKPAARDYLEDSPGHLSVAFIGTRYALRICRPVSISASSTWG